LLAIDWLDASVDVKLTPGLSLSGTPSLSGDNRCSFSGNFDADQARVLADALARGLPEGIITYHGRLRTRPDASSTTTTLSRESTRIETDDGARAEQRSKVTVVAAASTERAVGADGLFEVTAIGSIVDSLPDPETAVVEIELGRDWK
jgi:hypothetical protein